MSGMMDCYKRESGSEFEWKEMGFPKLANLLAMYPELIEVVTKPAPARVLPAVFEAKIDHVRSGKMALDKFTRELWNEFGYPIDMCVKDHKNVQTLLESMTQLVCVRKEDRAVVLYPPRGSASCRFLGVGGKVVEARSGLGLLGEGWLEKGEQGG